MIDMEISVVVPAYDESEGIPELFERIHKTLSDFGRAFEIVFVNDGSTDATGQVLKQLYDRYENVSVINLSPNGGKANALEKGFTFVRGRYGVIIDADLQQEPEDIPKLINKMEEGYDVVSCKRTGRQDASGKVFTSRVFNYVMRLMTGLGIEDYFSGLKAFRCDVLNSLSLQGDMYRFVAVIAYKKGFKVSEVAGQHHPRAFGSSKYNSFGRLKLAFRDLGTVFFAIILGCRRKNKRSSDRGVIVDVFLSKDKDD